MANSYLPCYIILLFILRQSQGQEYTVAGLFEETAPLMLKEPLKLTCRDHGDKIKISDILYKTTGCRNSPTKPQDPSTEQNKMHIDECTGKRTCVVPKNFLERPFLPRKPAGCVASTQYQISVIYTCVPQDSIRSMCSSFSTQEYMGYLSTPSYPMLLKPGEPVAPCKCHLEGTLNSRISLTLLESNLVGNNSEEDMHACQFEAAKQYLEIAYNRGNYYSHFLCSHKYNLDVAASSTYDLVFESPISREGGSLWIQYSAEEPNSMVSVSCEEPMLTTTATFYYTNNGRESHEVGDIWPKPDGKKYRLILGIVAAILFLLIIVAVIVITVKYNRHGAYSLLRTLRTGNISHYMMHKYSKRARRGGAEYGSPMRVPVGHICANTNGYHETHFDNTDDTMSCGKPTAHIPPQLSINEKLNKVSDSDPKAKLLNEKAKYASFTSTYVTKQQKTDSDSEGSESTVSKHSDKSDRTQTSETSSAPSSRRIAPPAVVDKSRVITPEDECDGPKFEDIWVRVNSPEMAPRRSASMTQPDQLGYETDHSVRNRAPTDISFSTAGTRVRLPEMPSAATLPLLQRSDDSRTNSEDEEEMDIKFVNPNLVSPFKTPVHAVKPALKSSFSLQSQRCASARRDSVKFSDIIERPSSHNIEYRYYSDTDSQKRQNLKSSLTNPRLPGSAGKHSSTPGISQSGGNYHPPTKLTVDLGTLAQQKSRSLPASSRHLASASSLKGFGQSAKRPKRKCASDNDKALISSQELLYSPQLHVAVPPAPERIKNKRGNRSATLPQLSSLSQAGRTSNDGTSGR